MTRTALEGSGKTLEATDEAVIKASGNSMAAARAVVVRGAGGDRQPAVRRKRSPTPT
jgi:hypothetical protein